MSVMPFCHGWKIKIIDMLLGLSMFRQSTILTIDNSTNKMYHTFMDGAFYSISHLLNGWDFEYSLSPCMFFVLFPSVLR